MVALVVSVTPMAGRKEQLAKLCTLERSLCLCVLRAALLGAARLDQGPAERVAAPILPAMAAEVQAVQPAATREVEEGAPALHLETAQQVGQTPQAPHAP